MEELRVEKLSADVFRPYGTYLGKPDREGPTSSRVDLSVWLGIGQLADVDSGKTVWGYLELKRHDDPVRVLERHRKTPEAFIPLVGTSVMVVAPVGNPEDPSDTPDQGNMKAFLLDGTGGIFFPRGSWHWAPFAVTETASFLIMVSREVFDDIEEKPIEPHLLRLY